MSDVDASQKPTIIELLSFRVGGQDYAIDVASTREIRGWTTPSELPDTPVHILGMINLRGDVLPLLDLAARLGLKTPEVNERSVIIVTEVDNSTVGLLVDAVSDIIAPSEEEMQPPPEAVKSDEDPCVRALTVIGEKMIRVLELSSVMPSTLGTPDQLVSG
ncbi:chemotaxis protein CheW [uncultured Roseobacter sp.]|uniref:chemotaxis protein CheW n=1 Tax=uncultured Roseobacter sp. TaxID=114847 RepID=UPI002631E565|nr:chemotaxis protein CheW [uncultured Roseobacter sp.]